MAEDSSGSSDAGKSSDSSKDAGKQHKAASGKDGFSAAKLPTAAVSFTAGVLVGTPIAVVRKCMTEGVKATKELTGETSNPFILIPVGLIGFPGGMMTGTLYGFYEGPKNAAANCFSDPFSKDSFSLGDIN